MTQDNSSKDNRKKKKNNGKKKLSAFRLIIVFVLMAGFITTGIVGGYVLAVIKTAPKIDPTSIDDFLHQSSYILDEKGNVIEKLLTEQNRTSVTLDKIPKNLQNAFISIEDERFYDHIGVDFRGIIGALIDDIKAGSAARGASTITQQLARNLYLTTEKSLERKIKEAYLAIQIEKQLTKDQILEAYLNRIYLGQGAYGVQEAAQTYFSKDVGELTLAECALIAGITKNPNSLPPYKLYLPDDVDEDDDVVGQVDILGTRYTAIFNPEPINRQKVILGKMLELTDITHISKEEYEEAMNEDIRSAIKPGKRELMGITSYFSDYVKTQVLNDLMEKAGYTKEEAEKELYTGGLKIYSTMNLDMQQKVEKAYENFGEILVGGNLDKIKAPILVDWSVDKNQNIIGDDKKIVLYKESNLFDESGNLIIEAGTYNATDDGNLIIKNRKLNIYPKTIDIEDYYTIDERKNLVKHVVGSLALAMDNYDVSDKKELIIKSSYLNDNKDFYKITADGTLLIDPKYFQNNDKTGVVQPQSATVVMDYNTGEIKALVGGRDIEGSRLFNRALSQRQPGSAIKPIAVYLPALDNGFTAASSIDDIPFYDNNGKLWPRNWYTGYRGLMTLRESVEQSVNVNAVKTLSNIGIDLSKEYLAKLGIIKEDGKDSIITRQENKATNDENLSALGLGGMTRGLTPLEITSAYGAIANNGLAIEPIAYTKVLDRYDNVILENKPQKTKVASPEASYIMSDILRTTVSNGIAGKAKLRNKMQIPVAGKTGTTQDQADVWFTGYTPYYVAGVWIGNDSPKITMSKGSTLAADFWSYIMTSIHEGYEAKNFPKLEENIVTKQICKISGKLATEICSRDPRGNTTRTEMFVKGTEPTEECDIHVEVAIDTSTGKLASENCPPELIENKVFIKRNPAYNPEEHNGLVPKDYQYTVPTEECDIHFANNDDNNGNNDDEWFDWFDYWFNNNNNNENNENNQNENTNSDSNNN
ncbi:transglycosylase domain-containing protein [Proteiniborus sp. MB09-C3]|uniref:penicillin-binding protein 1A n=1 Tax=Proteiniborus sp. MB09-C3 TaxID=3050072 RepID=UPI002556E283|nr:transglycosylase domain-containing protein [Proteiniborus sp. MB09-C3]WIV10727.1 transglycosylase domain-containing protein [Proteiniborus sp. MB09-C3]